MKASLPEVSVSSLSVGSVDVGQVAVGPLQVRSLVLDAMRLDLETGDAAFRDLRLTVVLTLQLDWQVTVKIPLARSYSWNGTVKMGTHAFTVRLGDVDLPGLQSLVLDVPKISMDDVQAVVAPLQDLALGPLLAEQLRLQGVVAPVPDFTLAGLGVGRLDVAGLGIPAATSARATVQRLHGHPLPLGTVTIPDLSLPSASAGEVTSESVDASGATRPVRFVADAGLLTLTLHATPGARLQADELRLSNVRTSASIGSLELQDVELPYEVLQLTLSDIGITAIDVPTLEVG